MCTTTGYMPREYGMNIQYSYMSLFFSFFTHWTWSLGSGHAHSIELMQACAVRPGELGAAQSGGFPLREYGVKGAAGRCTTWCPWVRVCDYGHGYMVYLLKHCHSLMKRTLQLSVYSVPQPHIPSRNPIVDDCPCDVNGRCLGFHPGLQPTEVLGCPHVRGPILALTIW